MNNKEKRKLKTKIQADVGLWIMVRLDDGVMGVQSLEPLNHVGRKVQQVSDCVMLNRYLSMNLTRPFLLPSNHLALH